MLFAGGVTGGSGAGERGGLSERNLLFAGGVTGGSGAGERGGLIIYTIVALLFATQAIAQNKIYGDIKDEQTKEILTGVTVYISNLQTSANSDNEGKYKLENIKTGTYLFEISFMGCKKRVEHIYIGKDTVIDFLISQSISELNEVVVTAVTRSTELKLSPIIIKPIDAAVLNQNSSTNLIDALKNIPGVNQITTDAGISKPTIRGLGYNRVISQYNGIRQEGQQWGDEHGIEIDEYSIDRIEIATVSKNKVMRCDRAG